MKLHLTMNKRWLTFLAMGLLFVCTGSTSNAHEKTASGTSPSQPWKRVEDILASDIPEVHSAQYCSQIKDSKEKAVCERAMAWGIDLARWLYQYQKNFKNMPWEEFKNSIGKLLELRDRLVQKPSYGNYALAGYIDLVVQEWLLQGIIVTDAKFDDIKKLHQISMKPFYTWKTLGQMIEAEYGKKVIDYEEMENKSPMQQFVNLWDVPQKLGEVDIPAILGVVELLKQRSAFAAISQVVASSASRSILKGLILFKEKGGAYPSTQKEFEAALQKTIPEILKEPIPETTQENTSSEIFWSTYQQIKKKGVNQDILAVESSLNDEDLSALDK